jgi:hypothetical protein
VSNAILVAMVVVLTLNYALVRIPGWEKRGVAYWVVQGVNLATAAFLLVVGVPDVQRIADWFLALLFVYHAVQNEMRARGKPTLSPEDAQAERRKAFEDAMEEGRADARDEINRP